jgi:uncharacterized protein YdeI (YjbR/CyaY-like superfamily)
MSGQHHCTDLIQVCPLLQKRFSGKSIICCTKMDFLPATDPRVDAYIAKSADFARPILEHLRKLVHAGCPGVTENIKWSFPVFDYQGSILCNMAAFKNHCSFGFWKASVMKDPKGILQITDRNSMGHFDRISSLRDLPPDAVLIAYVKEAARLNERKVKLPRVKKPAKKELKTPVDLLSAFKKNKTAQKYFDSFSPSQRREYIEWITEAKTEETRERRLCAAIEWIAEGKTRNWKYMRK